MRSHVYPYLLLYTQVAPHVPRQPCFHQPPDGRLFGLETWHIDLPDIQLEPPLSHVAGPKRSIPFERHLVDRPILPLVAELFGPYQRHSDLLSGHVLQHFGAQVAIQGVS